MTKSAQNWFQDPKINTALWAGVIFFAGIVLNDLRASAKSVEDHTVELGQHETALKAYGGMQPQIMAIQIDIGVLKNQQTNLEKKLDEVIRRLR